MKHIVCYSGGHSSALVAVEVSRKFGKENTVLLNHDIHSRVESKDIKRFKIEVADYLNIKITYANHPDYLTKDQIDVCVDAKSWVNPANRQILCTNRLKTAPFMEWLKENYETGDILYYGFDANEIHRIQRRSSILSGDGYKSDYPLALWSERTIKDITEIGINPPCQYGAFKHANCIGCLKAGWQHWFIVYCQRPDLWEKAKQAEDKIDHSIHKDCYLFEKEEMFEKMKANNMPQTEHISTSDFWSKAKKLSSDNLDLFGFEDLTHKPCECVF